jgi:hypothetical protein
VAQLASLLSQSVVLVPEASTFDLSQYTFNVNDIFLLFVDETVANKSAAFMWVA